ncbi:MAG: DUF3551 domain-containing protein [Bradyrhizobium sp.]|nr:DUF3551 domain-containing protein [Bradyrhizobium sp.]
MRKLMLVAMVSLGTLGITVLATPANAQRHEWCRKFQGALNCRYATHEQCRASLGGRGGQCVQRHGRR